jgi:hypothetical protein
MSVPVLIQTVETEGFGGGAVVAAAFGDMRVAGVFDGRDDGSPDGGQAGGPAAGPAGGGIFAGAHVADVVVRLDGPVLADQPGQVGRGGLGAGQACDGVDDLAGGPAGDGVLPPAGDLDGLPGPGEVQAADAGGLQGPGLDAAVPLSRAAPVPGTCRQGSALTWAGSSGWFRFTKRATDYDVSVPCCRARWWSRR